LVIPYRQGLKPSLILRDLLGAEAPLYHGAAGVSEFFRSLLNPAVPVMLKSTTWAVEETHPK